MASQITETKFFTSSANGTPIVVASSDPTGPTQIHLTGTDTLVQQAVYLTASNMINDRVLFWIYFQPTEIAGSITNSAVIPVNLGPYETRTIFSGERIGANFAVGGVTDLGTIMAFVDDAAHEDEVKILGHVVQYDQPGV
jgi:hypothetical protein